MKTIPNILAHSVRRFSDRPALQTISENGDVQAYTFRQVGRNAAALAESLRQWGIKPKDRVALLAENCPHWGMAYFGILLAEAVVIPVDGRLKGGEIQNILTRSRSRVLLATKTTIDVARQACVDLPELTVHALEPALEPPDGQTITDRPTIGAQGDDLAVISFSSGTTGTPKGVMLTHDNLVSNVIASAKTFQCGPSDRFLSLLPLSHIYEQTAGMLLPLSTGAAVTYMRSLNPRIIADAMRRADTTICLIVPAVARLFHKRITSALAEQPAWKRTLFWTLLALSNAARKTGVPIGHLLFKNVRRQFSRHLRFFMSGGAPLDGELAEFFLCLGLPILQGYGLSETAPVVSCNSLKHHRIGSVGRPIPGVDVNIMPVDGCDPGTGEILVRGANVMIGYYEDDQATRDAFVNGYFRTGDLGRVDHDGYLYITGRAKNVIIGDSGKNVYPEEVEGEITKSPLVKEVCVLGIRNGAKGKRTDEEVAALVVPHDDVSDGKSHRELADIVRNELKTICRNLADYKRPKHFAVSTEELPKTTTLKHKKHEIAKQIKAAAFAPL